MIIKGQFLSFLHKLLVACANYICIWRQFLLIQQHLSHSMLGITSLKSSGQPGHLPSFLFHCSYREKEKSFIMAHLSYPTACLVVSEEWPCLCMPKESWRSKIVLQFEE